MFSWPPCITLFFVINCVDVILDNMYCISSTRFVIICVKNSFSPGFEIVDAKTAIARTITIKLYRLTIFL